MSLAHATRPTRLSRTSYLASGLLLLATLGGGVRAAALLAADDDPQLVADLRSDVDRHRRRAGRGRGAARPDERHGPQHQRLRLRLPDDGPGLLPGLRRRPGRAVRPHEAAGPRGGQDHPDPALRRLPRRRRPLAPRRGRGHGDVRRPARRWPSGPRRPWHPPATSTSPPSTRRLRAPALATSTTSTEGACDVTDHARTPFRGRGSRPCWCSATSPSRSCAHWPAPRCSWPSSRARTPVTSRARSPSSPRCWDARRRSPWSPCLWSPTSAAALPRPHVAPGRRPAGARRRARRRRRCLAPRRSPRRLGVAPERPRGRHHGPDRGRSRPRGARVRSRPGCQPSRRDASSRSRSAPRLVAAAAGISGGGHVRGLCRVAASASGGTAACLAGGKVDRSYDVSAIDVDITTNRYGDHDPGGHMYALTSAIPAIRAEEQSRQVSIGLARRPDPAAGDPGQRG